MLIVLTAEIAAGVWSYQNGDKLEAFVKSNFKHTISNEYKVIETRTEIVDAIQEHFHCCGVDGPSDWSHSKYNNVKGGLLDLAISASKLAYSVPPSCCKNGTEKALCDTSRKGAITTSINPVIYKTVSLILIISFSQRIHAAFFFRDAWKK
jgi:Tetraspanin family